MKHIEPSLKDPAKDSILRLPDVKSRTGLSRSSIYAYIKDGKFPQHISLGERSVGWYESEVDAW
ncbi:MAG: AlpA family transcriptional regulator, partial [Rickettsiales bacterium]